MAKKFLRLFFVAAMLLGIQTASAAFKDFKVDLYPLLTEEQGTQVEFGVAFADDGSAQRVASTDATAALVVNGKVHNDHGMLSFSAKVNVEGPVKIGIGSCQYGTGDVTITNSEGTVVGNLNSNLGNCFSPGKEETIATTSYMGGATTLNITSKNYTRYLAVEKIETTKTIKADIISLLTPEENANGGTAVNFGVKMIDGAATRVAADDTSADLVISGSTNNNHGIVHFVATAPVQGAVKIGIGSCQYGNGEVSVTNSNGDVVSSFNCNLGNCYDASKPETIAYGYYKGTEATTLTINGKNYTPYISIEAVDPSTLVEEATVSFSLGDVTAEGVVPEAIKNEVGMKVAIPVNRTLYVEGKTLKGWTDGTATYAPGDAIEIPATDVTLTPVFADNANNLADRKEAVTVLFDFQRKNGAPLLNYQNKPGIYVTQAVVNGETIDVVTRFTTSPGKIANAAWTDWCQMNEGTTFTVPSCKGAEVSIEAYGDVKNTLTIDGQSDYTSGNIVNYTIGNTADNIDIVIGKEGSYYRTIRIVLPYVKPSIGGTVFTDEPATVYWECTSAADYDVAAATPEAGFSMTSVDIADMTISGAAPRTSEPATDFSFVKFKVASGNTTKWILKPVKGLTFTPKTISLDVQRFGTDAENGVVISVTANGTTQSLGNWTAPRANKTQAEDKFGKSSNYKQHIEIELTPAQQQALTSSGEIVYSISVGVTAANKEGGLAHLNFGGVLNGTVENVAKYPVNAVASPADAAEITIYPKSDEYEEGAEVKLTAAKNFGYKFVNWTDAEGKVVSEEPVFTITVDKAYDLTANLAPVNTYELNYSVDGGANLYMVTPSPASTVVDGKNMYEEGTNVSLVASSNPIVTFTNWSDGQTSGEIIVPMTQDVEIVANYSAVDFIAGWDFILSGNSGRPADFAAAENEAVSLILRDDNNDVQGWLDKSQASGGYEGRPGAVNWRQGTVDGDVGNYYFQTMVNASAFTDLKVQTSSVYNYNSYQKYDLQYSLDGENWTTIGSLNMAGTKSWTDLTANVPADADNKAEVYFRWYPDRNSTVDGTASKNDGFCLGATYITGTAKLVNDGVAPKLVSTVPVEGADNASANGKIVLTFDEKVKVAENAVATLGDQQLKPSVAGKVVTFEYKGLNYTTDYTFTLKGGSVMDLCDNTLTDDITIRFATKTKPEVAKALYDFIVPDDGNFREAIDAANARADKSTRFYIFIKQGAHVSPTKGEMAGTGSFESKMYPDPRVDLTANNVSIIGEGLENTSVTNVCPEAASGTTNPIEGLRHAYTLHNSGNGTYIQDIKLINGMNDATGRGEAYEESGDKTILKNVGLWGYQDTYCSNNGRGRYYIEGGVIRGRTDYICGKDDIFFNGVEFRNVGDGGYIAVPSSPKQYGWILRDCRITAENPSVTNGKYTLGRPWGKGTPIALWINTICEVIPKAEGWNEMSGGYPKRFAEYNSMTKEGTPIDLKNRKTTFGDGFKNDPILTAEEAAFYTISNVLGGDDDWDPTAATEQASAPTKVSINDLGILNWDNSNYVLLWAVCCNGKVVDFTIEPTYNTNGVSGQWSVRAANEMGGLSEAAIAGNVDVDIIMDNQAEVVSSVYFNVAGARVDADYEGVVIRIDTLADGTTVTTKMVNK